MIIISLKHANERQIITLILKISCLRPIISCLENGARLVSVLEKCQLHNRVIVLQTNNE